MSDENIKLIKLSQASSLAKIISNKTAQLIIEYIGASKKATATQLSNDLNLPASTVHYNMKALVKGGIIDDSQFTYSSKGKTIIHYKLTNNILVIIPETRDEFSVLNSIKALVPSILGIGVLGFAYYLFKNRPLSQDMATESARMLTADYAQPLIMEAAPMAAKSAPEITQTTVSSFPEFFLGLIAATIVITLIFLVRNYLISRKKAK